MFFIIGNPRSGTSLFRLLMTSHTRVHIPPECGFALWWSEKYGRWNIDANMLNLDSFLDDLFSAKKFEFWNAKRDDLKANIQSKLPKNYVELCQSIYSYHAKKSGKENCVLGDKNNFHLKHILDLNEMFPSPKFVHIIRDGRDVATSYKAMSTIETNSEYRPKLPYSMENIAKEWYQNISVIREGLSRLNPSQVLEIRYEDLVKETKVTLERVCKHLELSYEEKMLEYYLANEEKRLEPTEFMPWKARTLGKVDDSAIGKWKDLPLKDLQVFEHICGDVLKTYRYELSITGKS